MMRYRVFAFAVLAGLAVAAVDARRAAEVRQSSPAASLLMKGETHLANLRQLTFGGENAEAYFSPDGTHLIFQSHRPPETTCDQMYQMKIHSTDVRRAGQGG